jgi:hypothetical protein
MIRKLMVLMAVFFLMSPVITFAADFCAADNNGDCEVDLTDLVTMKSEFLKPDCEACSPAYPAPVEKTGQATSYVTGDDGEYQKGVARPNPRFTDNNNGTVTDHLTGLRWLKNANCYGPRTWAQALGDCNGLNSGECGLTDGSVEGDWRLPNLFELESLRDMAYYNPALSNTAGTGQWTAGDPFNNVQYGYYWSSTTYAYYADDAWYVSVDHGDVYYDNKASIHSVWPVRGGH